MVFFFTSVTAAGTFTLYMGRDKFENEQLIKFAWPEDVWFHVDDLSSAHVYVRLPPGMTHKTIPKELLADCAQLTKANSIEGNKKTTGRVKIVYTPASNLHKSGAMTTGQVGFHSSQLVAYTAVDARDNAVVNRLDKTRVEKPSDSIEADRQQRDADERRRDKDDKRARAEEEKRVMAERKKDKEARSYDSVFDERHMTSNQEISHATSSNEEDFDFM